MPPPARPRGRDLEALEPELAGAQPATVEQITEQMAFTPYPFEDVRRR
jgi:hypothetical protein